MQCTRCGHRNPNDSRFCNNCRISFDPGFQSAPVPPPPKGNVGKWILGIILACILGFCVLSGIIASLSGVSPKPSKQPSAPSASTAPVPKTTEAKAAETAWRYITNEDKIAGRTMKTALVQSSNAVEFAFPYGGEQHATLILRKRRGSDNVLLKIERGQLTCGDYFSRGVNVRFDDRPVRRFGILESADHDSTVVFIRNERSFIAEAKKAKNILIEAIVYQNGSPVFEFDTAGLEW